MKTSNKIIDGVIAIGWSFSGAVSFFITFVFSIRVASLLIEKVVGDTIMVAGETRITQDYLAAYAFIPWFGIVIGVIQYLLLSLRLPRMGWWILTTTFGWSLVFLGLGFRYTPLGTVRIPPSIWIAMAAGILLGLVIGLAQWLILRVHVPQAAWWIPTNMLGFGIAGLIFGNISSLFEPLVAITIPSLLGAIVLWLFFDKLPGVKDSRENGRPNPA